jgi:hypothetical protein
MTATDVPPDLTDRVKTHLDPHYLDEVNSSEPLATFLGLFSVGLGLAELAAPNALGDAIGVRRPGLLRAYGARELAAGAGILANRRPAAWLWGRVAGDVMDLATLGAAYCEARVADRPKVALAAAAVAGVTVLDVICAQNHSE